MPTAQIRHSEGEHAEAEEGRPGAPTPAIEIGPSALTGALQRGLVRGARKSAVEVEAALAIRWSSM
jgi:hypothetical protein